MRLILFFLLQTPAPESPLDASVNAFVRGDENARGTILGEGVSAILALRKVRERAPERVEALLFEIKKAAAGDSTKRVLDALHKKISIDVEVSDFWKILSDLPGGFLLVGDTKLLSDEFQKAAFLKIKDPSRKDYLDALCRQTDLDYGFFDGVVLIAAPERLWPPGPPQRSPPLGKEDEARARRWIEQLDSDSIEERTAAAEALRNLGPSALPVLEEHTDRREPEISSRCRDLVARAKPPPAPTFRLPGAARQYLAGADAALAQTLMESNAHLKIVGCPVTMTIDLVLKVHRVPCRFGDAVASKRISLYMENHSVWVTLALICHATGCDFIIQAGEIIVDTKEEIQRQLGAGR